MSFNIVDAVLAHVTPDEVQKLSSSIGASPEKTQQAMSTGILGIAGSVIHRASTPAGAAGIFKTLGTPLFGGANNLTESFLGDRGSHVTDVIAKASGIGRTGAHGIMGALLPLVASVLGHQVTSRGLDAGGLMNWLQSQKSSLLGRAGFGEVANAIGLHDEPVAKAAVDLPPVAPPVPHRAPVVDNRPAPVVAPRIVEEPKVVRPVIATAPAPAPALREMKPLAVAPVAHTKPKRSWIPAAVGLGVVALGLLLWAGSRSANTPQAEYTQPVVETPAAGPVEEPVAETKVTAAEIPKASDDLKEHFEARNIPDRLTLNDVTFDFATTKLATGMESIDHLATLMKEHPSARVRLEGNTDSTGSADVNAALSFKRATAVRNILVEKGIDANRLDVLGMGERNPVTTNATDEGRAKNRRLDAVILVR